MAVAERLAIRPGDRVMCTKYLFREAGEPMMLSTSWEPLAVTGRTPVMLPEEGPLGGMGVVERMAAIDVVVDNVTEEVGARPGLAELLALGGVPGHVVLVVHRTYYASGRPVETADVVVPADRYQVAYHLPVSSARPWELPGAHTEPAGRRTPFEFGRSRRSPPLCQRRPRPEAAPSTGGVFTGAPPVGGVRPGWLRTSL